MKVTELIIVIVYLIFCVVLGFITQKQIAKSSQGVDDYYVAGRNIGTFVNSLAVLAAVGSGGSFMAGVGTAWNLGLPFVAWMCIGTISGVSIASILVAKPMRNAKILTITEFISNRYDGKLFFRIAVPIVLIIGSGMYLMSQLKAGGLITSFVTGLSYEWGLIIITLIFILYVSMGGMLAVTWTNVIQGFLLIILIGVFVVGILSSLTTGWTEYFVNATTINPSLGTVEGGPIPVAGYLGAFVTWATAVCVTPHIIMRAFTSTSVKSAKLSLNISMMIFATLMLLSIFVILPFIPNLGDAVLNGNPSDMWMLLIGEQIFGPLLMGIVASGIMASIMSSTDSLLLALSSAVAFDLYKGVINKDATRSQVLKVSFIATWIIGVFIMILSINPPPFILVLYTAAVGFMVASLFAPLVLGIWWKRANIPGAIVGLLTGSISYLGLFLLLEMPYNSEVLISLPLSIISMMIVSLLTVKPSDETIKKMQQYHTE